LGWLLGIGTGVLGVAVAGGLYEYMPEPVTTIQLRRLADDGWGPAPERAGWLRRPRFRPQ
jgi:hypothetical protein